MMIPIALGSLFLLKTQEPLPAYKLLGKVVQAALPSSVPANCSGTTDFQGWHYDFSPTGELLDRRLGTNAWDELTQLSKAKAPPVAEWRAKFVLFEHVDILDKGADGVLRTRDSGFYNPDIDNCLHSIALLGAMIEAYSGGKLKFVPEVEEEQEPLYFTVPDETPFDAKFARTYFTPRLNGGAFEPDDKVYRGPYNSVFFIHSALSRQDCFARVYGMPISGLSFWYDYDPKRPGRLARCMFNDWVSHLVFWAGRHGYQLGALSPPEENQFAEEPARIRVPIGWISDDMWASLANMLDTSDFPSHQPAAAGGLTKWSGVADSPWTKLPLLQPSELAKAAGISEDQVVSQMDARRPLCEVGSGTSAVEAAEPEFAAFVAADMSAESDPPCLGFIQTADGPKIVFKSAPKAFAGPLAAPSPSPVDLDFVFNPAPLAAAGDFEYTVADTPDKRKAAVVTENWVARTGWLKLFGGVDLAKTPFLQLKVKPLTGSFSVTVAGSGWERSYALFGTAPIAAERRKQSQPEDLLAVPATRDWQEVTLDLRNASPGGKAITGIYLTGGLAADWTPDYQHPPSVAIEGARLSASGAATAFKAQTVTPDPTSPSPEAKCAFLATVSHENYDQVRTSVLSLLKDGDETVALNAANVYCRVKDPKAEDALAALVKDINPRVCEAAVNAMAFQGTDTARGPLITALQIGPFEHNRMFAAQALAKQKDPELRDPFSDLKSGRFWQTRLAAAQGLAEMPGIKPQEILMGFLLETNPAIEVAITQAADTSQDFVVQRMQWYAVNDSFDSVRAGANIALLRSTIGGYPAEGLKGLKDDSDTVRILILDYLSLHPMVAAKPAIAACLADPHAEVRAAAVTCLAKQPGFSASDLDPLKSEKDQRVEAELRKINNGG